MAVDFPYRFDGARRTAAASSDEHVRDLIEQVLFTTPGERLNRPHFGSGLLQLVFAPAGDELVGATQFLVQSALEQWLGDLIAVEQVEVSAEDGTLRVAVSYTVRRTGERQQASLARAVGGP